MMQRNVIRAVSLLLIIICIFINKIPEAQASDVKEINTRKFNDLQEKVAKGYSSKLCNGIGIGISKEGATKLAITENMESRFNPSLWFELASSGKSNLEKIDEDKLAEIISENVINDCGYALGLSGQKGVDSFKSYFVSIKNEIETQY